MKGNERNMPCPCGSGKKRKVCLCWQIELAHEEALRENEYWEYAKRGVGGRSKILQAIALEHMINGPFKR